MKMKTPLIAISLVLAASACGRSPSRLLRQGQLALNDFPLFLTDGNTGGTTGRLIRFERDKTQTDVATGLDTPQGVATDKFGNVYVVEAGSANRVRKFPVSGGAGTTLITGLSSPSNIAVDSFGEVYITEDGTKSIKRVSDGKVMVTLSQIPTALTIGVDDTVIYGAYYMNQMFWGLSAAAESVTSNQPVNAAVDNYGLVYVAEDYGGSNSKIVRFDQKSPTNRTDVASGISSPQGIAVDPVGNVYIVQSAGSAGILIAAADGSAYLFRAIGPTTFLTPKFIAFTQY
ncbi:MAG: NHL repeat-containing protein [Bdellovibrionales bacterium]|nr:NHL repeat-containing protein [Bdellovibrionales bacterium]